MKQVKVFFLCSSDGTYWNLWWKLFKFNNYSTVQCVNGVVADVLFRDNETVKDNHHFSPFTPLSSQSLSPFFLFLHPWQHLLPVLLHLFYAPHACSCSFPQICSNSLIFCLSEWLALSLLLPGNQTNDSGLIMPNTLVELSIRKREKKVG